MDPVILDRSLKLIEEIYNESMYGDKDIYRIKDVIHSVDQNHWKSKQWLADIFRNVYKFDGGKFVVLGGWYGMTAYHLRSRFGFNYHIISSDMDPNCEKYGYKLFFDQDIDFKTVNMFSANNDIEGADAIITTSVEHIDRDDLISLIKLKEEKTWVVLQSNNFHDHPTHINTSQSLDDFVEYLKPHLTDIVYARSMSNGSFDRYMVIGR